jgi:hypothetical protein
MFPFRPLRAATALLELAEAMLAPDAFGPERKDDRPAGHDGLDAMRHPHRRGAAIDRRRRPAPPQPEQSCVMPLTRAAQARETLRS